MHKVSDLASQSVSQ